MVGVGQKLLRVGGNQRGVEGQESNVMQTGWVVAGLAVAGVGWVVGRVFFTKGGRWQ